ncbi:MAG: pentapeptide repeat-containing protein [Polyangiaceae bacterium]
MEPVTMGVALKVLGKAFSVGLAAYKVRRDWSLKVEELEQIETFVSGSAELVGMLKSGGGASPRMFALHTALVMRAFGTACGDHWADDKKLAPGLGSPSRLQRFFLSKKEEERRTDIETRLRRALDRIAGAEEGSPQRTFEVLSAMVDAPLSSPCYQALWEAFTNPLLEEGDGTQARLLEMEDPGARLEFERAYRLAYAEALVSPGGVEVARSMTEIAAARPQLLRELIVRGVSTWKRQHVFGEVETPGVPNMPLEDIYVEPDGVWVVEKEPRKIERREPIRQLVRDLLREHKIVVVRGDFGHGKSLTARTLACEWAEAYLGGKTTSSPDLVYPVFIKCGVDFANHDPSLAKVLPRAFRNQARALKIDLTLDDGALVRPAEMERIVYIVDGLDEVALTSAEVEDFFKGLDDQVSERHRAVVLSRKGVLPSEEKLRGIPVIDVQHLRLENEDGKAAEAEGPPKPRVGGQVGEWLDRWNRLSGKPPITTEQIKAKNLLDVVTTPILLFMTALTWDAQQEGVTLQRAEIYERFFLQIAAGKCQQDQQRHEGHQPVIDASRRLLEALVDNDEIKKPRSSDSEPVALAQGMLWLMGRIAWEGQRCEQQGSDLTLHEVTAILRDELKIRSDPRAEEMIKIGVLLVLQADHHGGNDRILFGHKSFREFLVARYWAGRLRRIIEATARKQGTLEESLLGARLLGEGDGTFEFLVQILDGPDFDDEDRKKIAEWANECFNEESPKLGKEPSWLTDLRPALREAALAIGSSIKGSEGMSQSRSTTLRTLLAWFWVADKNAIVLAPRLSAPKAHLRGASLRRSQLPGANLVQANLEVTDLIQANLIQANLSQANLFQANLIQTNLIAANLQLANLQLANLIAANLFQANLFQANLAQTNFTQANLAQANLIAANLIAANLIAVNLEEAKLEGTKLINANLEGANLIAANLVDANLEGAKLGRVRYDRRTQWPVGFDITAVAPSAIAVQDEGVEHEENPKAG